MELLPRRLSCALLLLPLCLELCLAQDPVWFPDQPPRQPRRRAQRRHCDYPTIYLIPGSYDTSCTRREQNAFHIDTSTVKMRPEIIKLPGCFELEMEVSLLEGIADLPPGFLSKLEFQWWNFPKFAQSKCQEQERNGCGGYGNNCFYCDICNQLEKLDTATVDPEHDELLQQVKGFQCPTKIGRYRYRRRFCLNDWAVLDEDGDCELDFIDKGVDGDYRQIWESLRQIGFGSVIGRFHLSHNATTEQFFKKRQQEAKHIRQARNKMRTEAGGVDPDVVRRRAARRTDRWHRRWYLPWLLYQNQVSCLKVTFDVCDHQPFKAEPDWRFPNVPTQWECRKRQQD